MENSEIYDTQLGVDHFNADSVYFTNDDALPFPDEPSSHNPAMTGDNSGNIYNSIADIPPSYDEVVNVEPVFETYTPSPNAQIPPPYHHTSYNILGCNCNWGGDGGHLCAMCKPGLSCGKNGFKCTKCCYCFWCWCCCFFCTSARLFQWSTNSKKCGCMSHCCLPCLFSLGVFMVWECFITGIILSILLIFFVIAVGVAAVFLFFPPLAIGVFAAIFAIGVIISLGVALFTYLSTPCSSLIVAHRHNLRKRSHVGHSNEWIGDSMVGCPCFLAACTMCQMLRTVEPDAWDYCCPSTNEKCCDHCSCSENECNYLVQHAPNQ